MRIYNMSDPACELCDGMGVRRNGDRCPCTLGDGRRW
jgi:hypothetical protein